MRLRGSGSPRRDVLLLGLGTRGDVHPVIAVARELQARGRRVTVLSNDVFREIIEGSGLHFVSIGTRTEFERGYHREGAWVPGQDTAGQAFRHYYGPAYRAGYAYVHRRFRHSPELLVVTTATRNGVSAAAHELGIPRVLLVVAPNVLPSLDAPPAPLGGMVPAKLPGEVRRVLFRALCAGIDHRLRKSSYMRELNAARAELGLVPLRTVTRRRFREELKIGLFPGWYAMRPRDWPTDLQLVGFPLCDPACRPESDTVHQFLGEVGPAIAFTSGTGVRDARELHEEGQKICAELGVPGLFVGGLDGTAATRRQGSNLFVPYVDFASVLPRCAALVHHGGIGTLAQAVRAGIPQLIRPLAFDQPDNASRVRQLGIGEAIPRPLFCKRRVVPVLRRLLGSPQVRQLALAYAGDLRRSQAVERTCDLIDARWFPRTTRPTSQTNVGRSRSAVSGCH